MYVSYFYYLNEDVLDRWRRESRKIDETDRDCGGYCNLYAKYSGSPEPQSILLFLSVEALV